VPSPHDENPYYQHKVRLFTENCATGRVLDYGCGTGSYSRTLAAHGWEVWGVDANATRLAEAQAITAREGLSDTCRFVEVAIAEKELPFDDGHFDSIFASEVIEHVPDMLGFIGELKRVLRKGGSLYLTTPNGVSYRHVAKNLIWRADRRIPQIESWPQYLPGKEGHIYYWDLWTLYRLMHINGFSYVAHAYAEPHPVFRILSQALPPMRPLRTGLLLVLEHTDPDLHYR
jgi:SAM-dependent methyltransferase